MKYRMEGETFIVRPGRWDAGIIGEVFRGYAWERLPERVEYAMDIGAHIGSWTRKLKRLRPGARVVACEMVADNFHLLKQNLAGLPDVTAVYAQVGYSDGGTAVWDGDCTGGAVAVPRDYQPRPGWEMIDVAAGMPVEAIMFHCGLPRIDVLKIDAEWSEYDILGKMSAAALATVRMIVGERHGELPLFEKRLGGRLRGAGFTVEHLKDKRQQGTFIAFRG